MDCMRPPNQVTVTCLDVQATKQLGSMIDSSDLVVSLVPATLHPHVARMCIARKTNMVTASYVSPDMQELHAQALDAGVTILNEIGLDPGIDHLSAMKMIHQVKANDGSCF